jgi:mRNA interferase MazF
MQQTALKYDTEVKDGGRLELDVPLAPGVAVTVFVIESPNGVSQDLLSASQSSLVISNDQYNRKTSDIVVVAMTSNPQVTEYSLSITSSDLVEGALNRPGKIRVDKIYTLSQTIVAKTFGQVDDRTLNRIRRRLVNLVASAGRLRAKS